MKQILLFIFIALSTAAFAQQEVTTNEPDAPVEQAIISTPASPATNFVMPKIGYFSYNEVLKSMHDYAIVQRNIADLKKVYDAEIESVMKEFNEKYEYFLDNQNSMADVIREKRQGELQSMLERNVAFRQETDRLLKQAEKDAMRPLEEKIKNSINILTSNKSFMMIVNTDSNSCPYINPIMSEDVTEALLRLMQ